MTDWTLAIGERYREAFGGRPAFAADAGGRVNLIGEHTDYHDGFVFPAAIDLRTRVAARPRTDGKLRIRSLNLSEEVEAPVDTLASPAVVDWRAYVLGPFWALREAGIPVAGADVVVDGGVPFGGGLSSSAAIEVALVALGAAMAGRDLAPMDVARLARRAENGFCRVPCGAMDQVASACGREGHALLLDCRTLTFEAVPIPGDWVLVVADSGVRHSVGGGEYAARQAQCAEGMVAIRAAYPDARAARDVSMEQLESVRGRMPDVSFRRLRHAITENDRCLSARDALALGDADTVGRLLAGSHRSLAGDYEVSCAELDALVEAAVAIPGCIGARLTGAGFGGNTVNVVEASRVDAFCGRLADAYRRRTGRSTTVRAVRPAAGVSVAGLEG